MAFAAAPFGVVTLLLDPYTLSYFFPLFLYIMAANPAADAASSTSASNGTPTSGVPAENMVNMFQSQFSSIMAEITATRDDARTRDNVIAQLAKTSEERHSELTKSLELLRNDFERSFGFVKSEISRIDAKNAPPPLFAPPLSAPPVTSSSSGPADVSMRDAAKRGPPSFGSDEDELGPKVIRPASHSPPPRGNNTTKLSFRTIGARNTAGDISPRFVAPIDVEEGTTNYPRGTTQKPTFVNIGTYPYRLDRDEREQDVKRIMGAVGYIGEYKVKTGRDPMDTSVGIDLGSFEAAREFRIKFREHPAMKFGETPLFINLPSFGRERVMGIYSKRAHDLLIEDKVKYGIDPLSTSTFSRASGGLFVGRLKVGYVNVGMVRGPKGYPVSFAFNKECPEAFKKEVFLADFTAMVA